jgi:hypothetical protein
MKSLRIYYAQVGLPILLVLIAAVVFWPQILSTVQSNPHPQINYVIFVLTVIGFVQVLWHVRRLNREGDVINAFFKGCENGGSAELVFEKLDKQGKLSGSDATSVLEFLAALHNQTPGALQHAAIESEITRFQARQNRRLLFVQFMAGMMVGVGLLGTFIGLLGALAEIGKLIGSFNLSTGIDNPVAAISELVTRLTAPMQAMGVAFSASLFGVLGSLIMGLLMVSVRGAASDLTSILHSKVTQVIDFSQSGQAHGAGAGDEVPASFLTNELPTLIGNFLHAGEQSERRSRETLASMGHLAAKLELNVQAMQAMSAASEVSGQQRQLANQTLERIHQQLQTLAQNTARSDGQDTTRGWSQVAGLAQQSLQSLATEMERQMGAQAHHLQDIRELVQREQQVSRQTLENFAALVQQVVESVRADTAARAQFAHQMSVQFSESTLSQERVAQAINTLATRASRQDAA